MGLKSAKIEVLPCREFRGSPETVGAGSAHMQCSSCEYLLPVSGRWTFLCLCHRTCACMCMKPPYMRV